MKSNEVTKTRGTYAGMKFDSDSVAKLISFAEDNDIPKILSANEFHTTLLYSRKYLPNYEPIGMLDEPLEASAMNFEIWDSPANAFKDEATRCLILKMECPEQVQRFNFLMDEHGASYDYDEYIPHTTLSYDVGDDFKLDSIQTDLSELNPLYFVEEYSEILDLDKTYDK